MPKKRRNTVETNTTEDMLELITRSQLGGK